MDDDYNECLIKQLILTIDNLDKRITSLKMNFIKEHDLALNVINNENSNENRDSIKIEIEDLINDTANKVLIFYTECMNKIQRVLTSNIK